MISRILVVTFILVLGGLVVFSGSFDENTQQVLGLSTDSESESSMEVDVNLVNAQVEISRLREILERRPDYATAWLRLAVLYEQLGEKGKSDDARAIAGRLNPDLQ